MVLELFPSKPVTGIGGKRLTIGADPEFFVWKGHRYVSGHNIPCGSKENPTETKHGWVQNDGLALEVNVRPSTSPKEFIQNLDGVLRDLHQIVHTFSPKAQLRAAPYVRFSTKTLKKLPPAVRALGCHPDFNAYTMLPNPVPDASLPIRTGAGHIHVGFRDAEDGDALSAKHYNLCAELTKELDYFLGLPSLIWDRDETRRKLYGQAGAFRPKPYGLEYRVLSNAWVPNKRLALYIFHNVQRAVERVMGGVRQPLYDKYKALATYHIEYNDSSWLDDPALVDTIGLPPVPLNEEEQEALDRGRKAKRV